MPSRCSAPRRARRSRASRPPPVPLDAPIEGEAAWAAIRRHAKDAAYRRAVGTLRGRYALVANPMLLPNTLRTAMAARGLSFREAVIAVAAHDGLG